MHNKAKKIIAAIFVMIVTLVTLAQADTQAPMEIHVHACYMPDGTQQYHYFEYDTAPDYDLCIEVGGTAY